MYICIYGSIYITQWLVILINTSIFSSFSFIFFSSSWFFWGTLALGTNNLGSDDDDDDGDSGFGQGDTGLRGLLGEVIEEDKDEGNACCCICIFDFLSISSISSFSL